MSKYNVQAYYNKLIVVIFIIGCGANSNAQHINPPKPDSSILALKRQIDSSQSKTISLIDSLINIVEDESQSLINRRTAVDILVTTRHHKAYDFLLERINLALPGMIHPEEIYDMFAEFACFNALTRNGVPKNNWLLFERIVVLYSKEISFEVIQLSAFIINSILSGPKRDETILESMKGAAHQMDLSPDEKRIFDRNFQQVKRIVENI